MSNWLQGICNYAFINTSDINQHIPTLYFLANQCEHVTELGVRQGVSSAAFLYSQAKVRSYDITITRQAQDLFNIAKNQGKDAELICADSLKIENFEPTDLLFIDTKHTYSQAIQELNLYSKYVRKWIVLHDTDLFGITGENGEQGLAYAVNEFLSNNRDWQIAVVYQNNNGLTVLKRV